MKKLFTLISIVLIAISINAQTNLIPNPDFETDDAGWTNSGADSRSLVTPGYESTQAFQVTGATNKGVQYITDGTTELQAGDYVISFWAKGTIGEVAKFKVKFGDASTKTVVGTAFKASDAWEFFKLSFTLDATKTIDKFILQCNSPNTMTFVADDLFFGEDLDGPDPIEPVDPEFSAFPFTEDFENAIYVIGNTLASFDGATEADSWTADNGIFDRFWRGNNTNAYDCTVDADAYNQSAKAMKLTVTNKNGVEFKLRTVNIAEGHYDVSFYAKTDANGVGTAKIGLDVEETNWHSLTSSYTKYTGTFEVKANENNGTTRLSVFYTAGASETEGISYNLWVDDITISESTSTAINTIEDTQILFYPNPVHDRLNINSNKTIDIVEIYNLTGAKVLSTTNNKTIDVSGLPIGIYIVTANINGKTIQQKINKK